MTTDNLNEREIECFEAMDRVLDRMIGEIDWHQTRRAFVMRTYPISAFDHARDFVDLKDYSDDEIRAALRELRARTA